MNYSDDLEYIEEQFFVAFLYFMREALLVNVNAAIFFGKTHVFRHSNKTAFAKFSSLIKKPREFT
jgi:hypothetical protein